MQSSLILRLRNILPIIMVFLAVGLYLILTNNLSSTLTAFLIGFSVALLIGYGFLLVAFVYRTPTSLTISLLGFPDSGKTVFLTVLFDELMTKSISNITFSPYGTETVERVIRDLNTLAKGQWLLPTRTQEVFPYRANASIGKGIIGRRFKLEISDYAGEHIKELDIEDAKWLHKTDYFAYVVQSEIILLSIDSDAVMKGDDKYVRTMENSFIAALQLIIENKGVDINRKLQAPVALIFMKSDLVKPREIRQLSGKLQRLINLCKRRCRKFKVFTTSSVGEVNDDGSPPSELKPKLITEPIIWALKTKRNA